MMKTTQINLPEDFLFKDCSALLTPVFVMCDKPVYVLKEDKTVNKITSDKNIFLPSVIIDVLVQDVSVANLEKKYEDQAQKIQKIRSQLLKTLKLIGSNNTVVSSANEIIKGQGIFFYFYWMAETAEKNKGMLFSEKFSAVWSTGRIIPYLTF